MALPGFRKKSFNPSFLGSVDWQIVLCMTLLCGIGLTVVYSAGFNPEVGDSSQMHRQAISMGIGVIVFVICNMLSANFWRRWSPLLYGAGCILLVAILAKGVVAGGARRWIDFGGFRMQPSEFVKLGTILLLARLFSAESVVRQGGYTFSKLIFPMILILVPSALIIKQPDLGTGLCILLIGGSMLLLAGVKTGTLVRLVLVGIIGIFPAWHMLKDYQRNRIVNFVSPEQDPLGSGYHAIQSKIAVGSGAVAGKGFLKGTQTQLRFLPEQTTDFIFSVLAEEWGFVGSLIAVIIYAFLVFHLIGVSARCNERYPAFVAFGVAALVFWQMTVNIGMVIGIMPVVGITLPLLSFGGSSVVTIMAALGIASKLGSRKLLFG